MTRPTAHELLAQFLVLHVQGLSSAGDDGYPEWKDALAKLAADARDLLTGSTTDRDWTEDFGHENGMYNCRCVHCANLFVGHKRRVCCKVCATAAIPFNVYIDGFTLGEGVPLTRVAELVRDGYAAKDRVDELVDQVRIATAGVREAREALQAHRVHEAARAHDNEALCRELCGIANEGGPFDQFDALNRAIRALGGTP